MELPASDLTRTHEKGLCILLDANFPDVRITLGPDMEPIPFKSGMLISFVCRIIYIKLTFYVIRNMIIKLFGPAELLLY